MRERKAIVYTFTTNERYGIFGLKREEVRRKLDTGRPDIFLLLSTKDWTTEYRSPLPDQQERIHWREYYRVGSCAKGASAETTFVRIDRFVGDQQPNYGQFLGFKDIMDILEEAEPAHLTEIGRDFLDNNDRRISV